MKAVGLTIVLSVILTPFLTGQSGIRGKVLDGDNPEELIAASVAVYQQGVFQQGTATDFDGFFQIYLDPGKYKMEVSYIGYPSKVVDIEVPINKLQTLNITLIYRAEIPRLPIALWCPDYVIPLIDMDDPGPTPISSVYVRAQVHKAIPDLLVNFQGVSIGN